MYVKCVCVLRMCVYVCNVYATYLDTWNCPHVCTCGCMAMCMYINTYMSLFIRMRVYVFILVLMQAFIYTLCTYLFICIIYNVLYKPLHKYNYPEADCLWTASAVHTIWHTSVIYWSGLLPRLVAPPCSVFPADIRLTMTPLAKYILHLSISVCYACNTC